MVLNGDPGPDFLVKYVAPDLLFSAPDRILFGYLQELGLKIRIKPVFFYQEIQIIKLCRIWIWTIKDPLR